MSRYWPLPRVCTCKIRVRPFREEKKSREKETGNRKRDNREEREGRDKGYKGKEWKQGVSRVRVDAHRYHAVVVGTPVVTTLPCKRGPNRNSEALSPLVPEAPESAVSKPALGVKRFENRERKQGTPLPVETVTCRTCAAPSFRPQALHQQEWPAALLGV